MKVKSTLNGYDWSSQIEEIDHLLHIFECYEFDTLEARNNINDIRNILDSYERQLEKEEI